MFLMVKGYFCFCKDIYSSAFTNRKIQKKRVVTSSFYFFSIDWRRGEYHWEVVVLSTE